MKLICKTLCYIMMLIIVWVVTVLAHDVSLPVIVDTDGGSDDIRGLALLFHAGQVDVRLIVTSDGVLAPDQARDSVVRLMACMDQKSIPVVAGKPLNIDPPQFREPNLALNWPDCPKHMARQRDDSSSAVSRIVEAVGNIPGNILYLCLGPMTNLAGALSKDPSIGNKLERVLYLGGAPESDNPGWNTRRDKESARTVYDSGLPLYGLGLASGDYINFDMDFYDQIRAMETDTARLITHLHDYPWMRRKMDGGHMKIWDEMLMVYMVTITGFNFEPVQGRPSVFQLADMDRDMVKKTYLKLIGNPSDFHLDARKSVVMKDFPNDPAMMRSDVIPFVEAIISTHGAEEWKACLLTNELHRHLGIYSLVGAKMGIRARELLEAPFDTLTVVSHAGSSPPLSCMNDGLQVSTGASLGRGTITVLQDNTRPSAEFVKEDIRLTLTIKAEYVNRIRSDIKKAIKTYGGLGPAYFDHIRKLSIQYWKDFDRTDLFEESFSKH